MTKPEKSNLYHNLKELYGQGKFGEVISNYQASSENYTPGSLKFVAFSFYHQKKYDECKKIISLLEAKDSAELRAYIAAYVDKNKEELLAIYREFPHNSSVCNALVIYARSENSGIGIAVIRKTLEFTKDNSQVSAHLFHNGGRYFLEKKRYSEALSYLWMADSKYDKNSDHNLAALLHWISVTYEGMQNILAALEASLKSVAYWEKACEDDSSNLKFFENLENEKIRAQKLFEQSQKIFFKA